MGALASRAISRDEIVERGLKDAVIDRAHDNVPDGDMRDAAWLTGRLQVDTPPLHSLGHFRFASHRRCASTLRSLVAVSPAVTAARTRDRAESLSTLLVPSAPPHRARVAPIVRSSP